MERFSSVIFSLIFIAGCAGRGTIVRHAEPFPVKIAVLPFSNLSVDMQGPLVIRNVLETRLAASQYELANSQDIDEKLKSLGITDGGQINATTPQKLGLLLDTEALVYGELVEFKNMNIGVYSNRVVEAKLKLVDAKTGQTIWEAQKKYSNKKFGLDKDAIRDNLVSGYANKMLENILKNPLRQETEMVVAQLVKNLNKTRKNW